jgi:hypothetical protein
MVIEPHLFHRFVDRDMFMRYIGNAVGHVHINRSASESPFEATTTSGRSDVDSDMVGDE